LVFRFATGAQQAEALETVHRKLQAGEGFAKETAALHQHFSQVYGEVVDMNLDYFPDMVIVTFARHRDVLRGLTIPPQAFDSRWTFVASKIDFTCHVRNSDRADDPPGEKFLPIVFRPQRLEAARPHIMI